MCPQEPKSISQSIVGDHNVQSIGDFNRVMNTNSVESSPVQDINQQEFIQHLLELIAILKNSDELPEAIRLKVNRYLGAAQAEAEEEEPQKEIIAKNLERATIVLKEASETVDAGKSLIQKVGPIMAGLVTWLKPFADQIIQMLSI